MGRAQDGFQTTYEELKLRPRRRTLDARWRASRLPMRNWNSDCRRVQDYILVLPDYLWGIETGGRFESLERIRGFQTTYEELKLRLSCTMVTANWLPDYLWGIETSPVYCYERCSRASRLPMRNWNTRYRGRIIQFLGFQTTYEELKPPALTSITRLVSLPDYLWGIETHLSCAILLLNLWLPDYLWGIETQFREVHPWNKALPDYLWGIETPVFRVREFEPRNASRLPMRNWNRYIPDKSRTQQNGFQTTYEELKPENLRDLIDFAISLPDYLWGIETRVWMFFWRKKRRLPDYLWGIETPDEVGLVAIFRLPDYLWGIETFLQGRCRVFFCRFQTTYEELKLRIHPCSFPYPGLPDYLWGIETEINGEMATILELPDYLWGIETEVCHLPTSHLPSFQTTYEELKLLFSLSSLLVSRASRLPMRNWNTGRISKREWTTASFQTTYEELKRIPDSETIMAKTASRLPMRNWNWMWKVWFSKRSCFQTTYEELKPSIGSSITTNTFRFQTTYEELKHISVANISGIEIASRLPMRNWNSRSRIFSG